MRRVALLAAVAAASLSPAPSYAATSVQSGWWTTAPLAVAPDVPEGGILLQGGSSLDEPVAFGALSFALGDDEEAGELTVTVAESSATTPNASITVCPLTSTFTPAEAGPADDAPTFDCTTSVVADRSDDGRTFTVDAADLATAGEVAVALLPTAFTDRVVLEPPTPAALATSIDRTSTPATSGATSSPTASGGGSSSGGLPSTGSAGVPAVPRTPQPSSSVSVPPPPTTVAPAPAATPIETAAAPGEGGSSSNRGLLFLALVALTGALWVFAGAPHTKQPEGAQA